ncbi:NADH-quinone oxidoreductase subunit NuoH [Cytophagaceae bacterium DM2B3-1]|uniref:NADH-quinone oxidoreductase subunit H n=2 Tax=Xanthocytophaga flava TaxID=3048013 RepID=A0ABT7CLI0_9BACT|nr:NADH-quinone oxidoreductase subunit NuoH [Xanthocytophaga flavus]MDJ1468242.1 NADH-quinone oxidoreductase subunit NuoH [Xanthocytophaga flavus]MDJ1494609.1 NADH-quinone oxidoreductase subunit NuoH [Xanthocytophaga flavus]
MNYIEMDPLIVNALIILSIFGITLLIATYSTWAERKVAGFIQDRLGPNRAGWGGLMQPLADAGKMFFKEDFIPAHANKWLFIFGPSLAMLTACMASAVIPFGDSFIVGENMVLVQAIEVNIGILYVFGVVSLGVYGLMIGGWASNNKFSLLGAVRAASQNISYELAMGLSIIAIILMSGSLSLRTIVEGQHGGNWNILYQPLGFIIFLTCAFAECNRTPFDLPECETELIGGYHTEYSSMKLGFYLFAEYINMFASSAVTACLFFGGFNYPGMDAVQNELIKSLGEATGHNIATGIGIAVMFAKILFGIFFFMWVRWTLPRFRYDQLMNLGWKGLIPAAILNVILTGAGILLEMRWLSWVAVLIVIGIAVLQASVSQKKELRAQRA